MQELLILSTEIEIRILELLLHLFLRGLGLGFVISHNMVLGIRNTML